MSATDQVRERTLKCLQEAGPALDGLCDLAKRYQKHELASKLTGVKEELSKDVFKIIVAGRFKTGKSTFMNALLGRCTEPVPELAGGCNPLPSHDQSCTAILTTVRYADRPMVSVLYKDPSRPREVWSFRRFLTDSRVRATTEENHAFFEPILEFELEFPAELCEAGITLIDSPGLDDDLTRDAITVDALTKCDAAIVMFKSDSLAGLSEQGSVAAMRADGLTQMFFVVNLMNGKEVDEQLRARVWDKLVTNMNNGSKYCGQDLSAEGIYLVDAKCAAEAKSTGDAALLEKSGMAAFEKALYRFLEEDRRSIHMVRFMKAADIAANEIEREIRRRIPSLREDRQKVQMNYLSIQPQLEEIKRKKDAIPDIVAIHRQKCVLELRKSFDELANFIVSRIDEDVNAIKIPSLREGNAGQILWARLKAPYLQGMVAREAADLIAAKLQGHLTDWQERPPSQPGARQVCAREIEGLLEDLRRKVAEVEKDYSEAQLQFHGEKFGPDFKYKGASLIERLLAGGVGVFLGQFDYVITGGGIGWGGLARDFAGRVAVAGLLSFIGAPLVIIAPAAISAGFLANLVLGPGVTEAKVRKALAETLKFGDRKKGDGEGSVRSNLNKMAPALEKAVEDYFAKIEAEIMKAMEQAMLEEERSFRQQLRDSQLSADEKAAKLSQINGDLAAIKRHREALANAVLVAKQT